MRVAIFDGEGVFRRIFEAVARSPNGDDPMHRIINAFGGTLHNSLRAAQPTHILFTMDSRLPYFRNLLCPTYKADRPPESEDCKQAREEFVYNLQHNKRFCVLEVDGHESDDLIATAATRLASKGVAVSVMASDKDLAVLAGESDLIEVRDPFSPEEVRDDAWCRAKFGVPISQLQDYLVLIGDDGAPGVKGVGKGKAAQLISAHGGIDAILTALAAGEVDPKLAKLLVESMSDLEMTRATLALRRDISVEVGRLSDLRLHRGMGVFPMSPPAQALVQAERVESEGQPTQGDSPPRKNDSAATSVTSSVSPVAVGACIPQGAILEVSAARRGRSGFSHAIVVDAERFAEFGDCLVWGFGRDGIAARSTLERMENIHGWAVLPGLPYFAPDECYSILSRLERPALPDAESFVDALDVGADEAASLGVEYRRIMGDFGRLPVTGRDVVLGLATPDQLEREKAFFADFKEKAAERFSSSSAAPRPGF